MKGPDIEFLYEIGSMRNIPRAWIQHLGVSVASNLEHMMRVVFLALLIARREKKGDQNVIMQMALVHDIVETRTADLAYVHKVYADTHDLRAAHDQFVGTLFVDLEAIHTRYKKRDSIEAKIVKDADNLDIDLELKELEEQGHKLPLKWKGMRKFVRDKKLYTKTAKKIWDEIQTSNPSSWHLKANKWKKIPSAGR